MNDKTIINIISKTYATIVNFFIFTFLLLFLLFIVLQNGLFIENISTKEFQVKQLYIKWNERVDVSIKEIHLSKQDSPQTDLSIDYKEIGRYINSLSHTREWFNSLVIEKISYEDVHATFKYQDLSEGFCFVSSKDIDLNASLSFEPDTIEIKLYQLRSKKKNIQAEGEIYLDTKDIKIYSDININLTQEANLTLKAMIGADDAQYKILNNKKIRSIQHLIELAGLSDTLHFWAYEAITKMSYVTLDALYGNVEYNNIEEAYKNIYVHATVHDVNYLYNRELETIQAPKVELEFTKGILNIRPIEAYSYGMYLNKSWLYIDFTKKKIPLTLKLLFQAKLNKDILGILHAYKIDLPFLQHSGVVDTNLRLDIGLRDIDVAVNGTFYTQKANFDYIGLNIDIADANILLHNYDVTIKDMKAKYKDIAEASVSVNYNAKESKGDIIFELNKVALNALHLQDNNQTLHAEYHIDKKGDAIDIDRSQWNFKNKIFDVDELSLPFDLNSTTFSFPSTLVHSEDFGNAYVSGVINMKTWYGNLNVDLLKFAYNGIELTQSNTPLQVAYEDTINIRSTNDIHFSVSGSKYKARNLLVTIDKDEIALKHTSIEIGKYIRSKVYAKYDLKADTIHMSLSDFILIDPNTKSTLYKKKKILLSAKISDKKIKISSLELNADFLLKDNGWRLVAHSLNTLASNSVFLQNLHINDGDFTIYKYNKEKYTKFKASLKYPYKILVKENKPIEEYHLNGKIYKEEVFVEVNKNLSITMKDTMKIDLKDSTVNLKEVIRALKELNTSSKSQESGFNVIVQGKKSHLYIDTKRSILYDRLNMQYYEKILTAQLEHADAKAGVEFKDEQFHIYGKGFNDAFMNRLFSLSKFEHGKLNFSIEGQLDKYKGVIFINKTTLKDYKILNNILAFINTVPSLVTFNVPGYNKNGIFVKNAYLKFTTQDNNLTLNDIYLDSKEIDILGRGDINLNDDTMDIMLNLKTDLGSELSKVPIVGYVILGKDTLSTTLSMKGKLDDPKIKSLIAKDIIVAPLNIIKRTFLLPYNFLKNRK